MAMRGRMLGVGFCAVSGLVFILGLTAGATRAHAQPVRPPPVPPEVAAAMEEAGEVVPTPAGAPGAEQTPPAAAAAAQAGDEVEPGVEPGGEVYSYDAGGRRDPFVSLLARGVEALPIGDRPEGLGGLTINEVALRGIVRSRGAFVAIVQSPNDRTYMVREGDRLFDGTIRTITEDAIIFMQVVNDPLSLVTEREVIKPLRTPEDQR
ncbi:MAG: pilus assembly protein PilP [Vicinamibacterales bacterium]|nr:pilus assembly protein PilP [Vicinamibacterales bacterium]MDP6609431.1 pilus assembly protein PilP [Vicinamibacterales bacterium]